MEADPTNRAARYKLACFLWTREKDKERAGEILQQLVCAAFSAVRARTCTDAQQRFVTN